MSDGFTRIAPAYAAMRPRFAASGFRSRFRLTRSERAYLAEKGAEVLRAQAERIVRERLAPAHPVNDGRQTPMRGHPVFKAQHATATCCRSCFGKWHGIAPGHALTPDEIALAVDMIMGWLGDQAGDLSEFWHTPDLFDGGSGDREAADQTKSSMKNPVNRSARASVQKLGRIVMPRERRNSLASPIVKRPK